MESLQTTKRRIRSVQNINQITKAMELVAATKMRKSQEIAINSRPYAFAALDLLAILSELEGVELPSILEHRTIEHSLIILLASDKGLAGPFNSAVIRKFEKFMQSEKVNGKKDKYMFTAIGKKAARYLEHRFLQTTNYKLQTVFTRIGDFTMFEETKPMSDFVTQGYLDKKWDEVIVFSTHFRSALRQEPLERKIFTIDFESLRETAEEIMPETGRFSELRAENKMALLAGKSVQPAEYIIEPSPAELLAELVPHLIYMQMYQLILQPNPS